MLAAGLNAVLKIDVQGALTAMHLRPDAVSIFLLPPSLEELERRIRGRGTEAPEVIERRINKALEEIELGEQYGYQVVNADLDRTVGELQSIVGRVLESWRVGELPSDQ